MVKGDNRTISNRGYPSLTMQALSPRHMNIIGLITSSDAKEPQLRWIWGNTATIGAHICYLRTKS